MPIIGHVSLGQRTTGESVWEEQGWQAPPHFVGLRRNCCNISFVAFIPELTFDAPNTPGSASTWPTYKNTENRNHGRTFSSGASQP
jgi:hypothetical protein